MLPTNKKSPALAESSVNTRDSGSSAHSRARLEKAAWDVGAASAASNSGAPQRPASAHTVTWSATSGASDHTAGTRSSGSGNGDRALTTSTSSLANRGRTEAISTRSGTSTDAVRPRPKGAVGVGTTLPRGVDGGGGGRGGATTRAAPVAVARGGATYDLAGFVGTLDRGVLLTKINRQGKVCCRMCFSGRVFLGGGIECVVGGHRNGSCRTK